MADHNSGRTTPEQEAAFWNRVDELKKELNLISRGREHDRRQTRSNND
jgi:hypothetical protein